MSWNRPTAPAGPWLEGRHGAGLPGALDEEALLIDIKARLAVALLQLRQKRKLTQIDLARLLRSSQSRVAKMEAGDRSVSFDLLIRALLTLGSTRQDLAKVIGRK
jgi:predicted XRE-type DNA-binding protein